MSFHDEMRCKCKRKRKWKCEGVHTSNANAKKERYGRAVEVFFQDGRQRSSFCRLTSVGSIALTLAFAFALGCDWIVQFFAFAFAFAEVLLVLLIDRGRSGYFSYCTLRKLYSTFQSRPTTNNI